MWFWNYFRCIWKNGVWNYPNWQISKWKMERNNLPGLNSTRAMSATVKVKKCKFPKFDQSQRDGWGDRQQICCLVESFGRTRDDPSLVSFDRKVHKRPPGWPPGSLSGLPCWRLRLTCHAFRGFNNTWQCCPCPPSWPFHILELDPCDNITKVTHISGAGKIF